MILEDLLHDRDCCLFMLLHHDDSILDGEGYDTFRPERASRTSTRMSDSLRNSCIAMPEVISGKIAGYLAKEYS